MKIGIDIDETVTQTQKHIRICLKKYRRKYKLKKYSKEKQLSDQEFLKFMQEFGQLVYEKLKPKKNAVEVLKKWHEEKHEIYFITARHSSTCPNVELYTKNYFDKLNIKYNDIFFVLKNKYEKTKHLNLDIYIDDKEYELDKFKNKGILLLRIAKGKKIDSKYKNVSNWLEIEKTVKEKE